MSALKKKVMIAEDDPAILDSVKILLEIVGYEVVTTTDGQAVYDLREDLPDVILLDLRLTGTDGRDICRYLKNQERTKRIPVIVFSANNDIRQIAMDCGADGALPKPFEIQDLLQKIDSACKGN